jgi:hypothetical protein
MKLKFQKSRIEIMLIIFFDSQGIVHKELEPAGKTVNAVFYEGVMQDLLMCIEWVRPAAFCIRDFFLLQDNVPIHKAAFANFLPPKSYNPLSPPCTIQIYLCQTISYSPI